VKRISPKTQIFLGWSLCAVLLISGFIIGVKTLRNFNQATIVVEWSTASELETVGFNILRSEIEDGSFKQINNHTISSSNDPLTGGEYIFEDQDVVAGETYYYKLEEIENNGGKNQHGPIIQKATNSTFVNLLLSVILLLSSGLYAWLLYNPKKNQETQ